MTISWRRAKEGDFWERRNFGCGTGDEWQEERRSCCLARWPFLFRVWACTFGNDNQNVTCRPLASCYIPQQFFQRSSVWFYTSLPLCVPQLLALQVTFFHYSASSRFEIFATREPKDEVSIKWISSCAKLKKEVKTFCICFLLLYENESSFNSFDEVVNRWIT